MLDQNTPLVGGTVSLFPGLDSGERGSSEGDVGHTHGSSGLVENSGPVTRSGPLDLASQKGLLSETPLFKTLSRNGIDVSAHFGIAPSFAARRSKPYRGNKKVTAPSQEDLTLRLDLGKLMGVRQSVFTFTIVNRDGKSASAQTTGSFINYQFMYGQGQNFRLSELSLQQTFGKLQLKAGFYPMGNDFGRLTYTCNFVTNAVCGHPMALPENTKGWQDSPSGQWGGRARYAFSKTVSFMVGAWSVNPLRPQRHRGWYLKHKGTTGAIIPAELSWTPRFAGKAGTFRIGGYYDTSRAAAVGYPDRRAKRGRFGGYIFGAQQLVQKGAYTTSGLAAFGQIVLGDRRTAVFTAYQTVGLVYRGLSNSRPDDSLSFNFTHFHVNRRQHREARLTGSEKQTNEGVFELSYVFQATRWLLIHPSIAYDVRPGGLRSARDSMFTTLYLQSSF